MRNILLLTVALAAGCGPVSQPIAVIGKRGEVLKGTATASLSEGGTYSVTNGKITCGGSYDAYTMSPTVSFPIVCSDGRKGLGSATRDANGTSGSGTMRLSDGSDWTFVFGPAANVF